MKRIAFGCGWLTCSVMAWGMFTGIDTCDYPQFNHSVSNASLALFGPISAVVGGISEASRWMDDKHFQFRLLPLSREDRWRVFHELYPEFSRYYFDHGHDASETECVAADVTGCK